MTQEFRAQMAKNGFGGEIPAPEVLKGKWSQVSSEKGVP